MLLFDEDRPYKVKEGECHLSFYISQPSKSFGWDDAQYGVFFDGGLLEEDYDFAQKYVGEKMMNHSSGSVIVWTKLDRGWDGMYFRNEHDEWQK